VLGGEGDFVKFGNLLDVDNDVGLFASGAELHEQVRAAGEETGGGLAGEQTDGFREGGGGGVVEGFHTV
jgi:hypothetical protein